MFHGGGERGALALIIFGLSRGPITNSLTFDDFSIRVTVGLGEPKISIQFFRLRAFKYSWSSAVKFK